MFQHLSEVVIALTMGDVLRARTALLAALRALDDSQPVPSPARDVAGQPVRRVGTGRGRP